MESGQLSVYCDATPVLEARYDPNRNSSVVEAVAEAVAAVEGVDSTDLPPLYDYVDVEALNRLVDGGRGQTAADTVVGFTVERWHVLVRGDGTISVLDTDSQSKPTPVFAGNAKSEPSPGRRQSPLGDD